MLRDKHHGKPCAYCRRLMDSASFLLQPTRDHIFPKCSGLRTGLLICCRQCNNIKDSMMPDVWAAYMAANPGWWLPRRARHTRRPRYVRQGTPPAAPVVVPPELVYPVSS